MQNRIPEEEITIKTENIYQGGIIDVEKLTVLLPNGKTAFRDIVRHKGASAVVPITKDGRILLVQQYRKPNECLSIEIPAGKLDANEEPEICARREMEEETGYRCNKIEKLFSMQSTPGFSDEIIHVYLAQDLEIGQVHLDADEFVTVLSVTFHDAVQMIRDNRIVDGKTIAGIYAAIDRLGYVQLP